jgi:hypothetical protein
MRRGRADTPRNRQKMVRVEERGENQGGGPFTKSATDWRRPRARTPHKIREDG